MGKEASGVGQGFAPVAPPLRVISNMNNNDGDAYGLLSGEGGASRLRVASNGKGCRGSGGGGRIRRTAWTVRVLQGYLARKSPPPSRNTIGT